MRNGTLGLILLAILALPMPAVATVWANLTPPPPLSGAERGEQATGLPPLHADTERRRSREDVGAADSRAQHGPSFVEEGGWGGEVNADEQHATLARLRATPRPPRDPLALAGRVAGREIPWAATEPFVGPLQAGRKDTFFVLDQTDNQYKPRPATLRFVSEHAYWYVQDGESVRDEDLAAAAAQFDQRTVPTVRRIFGEEWSPGIDGDVRVTIFLGSVPGVSAYFSSWDEYPRSVYRYSNEREMIHVNLSSTRPGSASFDGTLAHEFQHMVHWHMNPQDDTWLDEGFAELASALASSATPPNTGSFQRQPDVQLTTWSQGALTGAHYQASYLFSRYFAQRFGQAAVGQLLQEQARPPESITTYLGRAGLGVTFDGLFQDWIVANLLDDPAVGDGRYAHDGIQHRATVGLTLSPDGQPTQQTVSQHAARYIELQGTGADAELRFEGAPSVRIVGTDATSGRGLWWSNRSDGLNSSLTRRFDLSTVTSATLDFNLWFDTEADFDFFYVMASADGGARWYVLRGQNADDSNPTGNAVGPGYSGRSGVPNGQRGEPRWLAETVDLTPFAGGEVLVRFEYVTDQGYNARGVTIDDIGVPEIGFQDDAEADGDWTADGFMRSDNVIPQPWSLQLVEFRRGGQTTVRPLQADATGQALERITGLGSEVERAVLVVSGLAPRTLEAAPFQVTLRPAP